MQTPEQAAIEEILKRFPALAQDLQGLLDKRPGLANCEPFVRILAAMLAIYPQTIGQAALAQAKDPDLRQSNIYLKNSNEHRDLWLWLMDFRQTMRQACEATPPLYTADDYAHAWLFLARCAYRVMERARRSRPKTVKKTRSRAGNC